MVDYNDRRPWSFTTPGDDDYSAPLDAKSVREANARMRSEDHSERLGSEFHVTNKAISKARRDIRKSKNSIPEGEEAPPLTVGDYMSTVQSHISNLVHRDVYDPRRGTR
jgi:hypothetical protein